MFRDSRYRNSSVKMLRITMVGGIRQFFSPKARACSEKPGDAKPSPICASFSLAQSFDQSLLYLKPFPPLDLWFTDAVEVTAPHINDLVARQAFLSSPQAFLIKHDLQACSTPRPSSSQRCRSNLFPRSFSISPRTTPSREEHRYFLLPWFQDLGEKEPSSTRIN